jgi:hypothetical protein
MVQKAGIERESVCVWVMVIVTVKNGRECEGTTRDVRHKGKLWSEREQYFVLERRMSEGEKNVQRLKRNGGLMSCRYGYRPSIS